LQTHNDDMRWKQFKDVPTIVGELNNFSTGNAHKVSNHFVARHDFCSLCIDFDLDGLSSVIATGPLTVLMLSPIINIVTDFNRIATYCKTAANLPMPSYSVYLLFHSVLDSLFSVSEIPVRCYFLLLFNYFTCTAVDIEPLVRPF
jgi:hypothetical protein